MNGLYFKVCIALALIGFSFPAQADNTKLISVHGPEIHGQVNTTTNTFVVTSWVENPGGIDFWTPAPSSLPLTYTALTSSGAVYDVPDNFNGRDMIGWAFISDLPNAAIQWNEGTYTLDPLRTHGWGGGRNQFGTIQLLNSAYYWSNSPAGNNGYGQLTFDVVNNLPEPSCAVMCVIASPLLSLIGRRRAGK